MKNILRVIFCLLVIILIRCTNEQANDTVTNDKDQLIQLEYNWLKAEFALDTAYLSSIKEYTFVLDNNYI